MAQAQARLAPRTAMAAVRDELALALRPSEPVCACPWLPWQPPLELMERAALQAQGQGRKEAPVAALQQDHQELWATAPLPLVMAQLQAAQAPASVILRVPLLLQQPPCFLPSRLQRCRQLLLGPHSTVPCTRS